MDLTTHYLGLKLPHPLVVGASPLCDDLDMVRRLEDAGAAALVMHSLFEEQIVQDQLLTFYAMEGCAESYSEATRFLPAPETFALGPDQYLEHIRRIKRSVDMPVIASLNGITPTGWTDYAALIQESGADALELNIYMLAADMFESGAVIEKRVLDVARSVRARVQIPLAVKLSPFFSSLPNLVHQLDQIGINGVVLFNRFYQPDMNIETMETEPSLHLSDSSELLMRLRWTAILSGRITSSLAISGGVHTSEDAIKAVMAGADCVQMVSSLLKHGPEHMRVVLSGMREWMVEHNYSSLIEMNGCMNMMRCPDPAAIERANYMRVLQGWRSQGLVETRHK